MLQESIKLSEEIECIEYSTIGNLLLAEYYFNRGKSSQSLPYYEKVYTLQQKRGIITNQDKIDELVLRAHPTLQDESECKEQEDLQPSDETDKISR